MAKLLIVAACALIDGDGRVLLARRPKGKEWAGLWEFPGGKLNDNETPEGALVRELKEELGIDVETACLAPVAFSSTSSAEFHLLMPLYACRKWKGVAQPLEAEALAWVKAADFQGYEMPPADQPLAAQLRDML